MKAFLAEYEQDTARRKKLYAAALEEWQAARAAQAKADKDRDAKFFRLRLIGASAGELFAIADEMSAAKKPDESREALIALVSRYSTDPLGLLAAKQLAAMIK